MEETKLKKFANILPNLIGYKVTQNDINKVDLFMSNNWRAVWDNRTSEQSYNNKIAGIAFEQALIDKCGFYSNLYEFDPLDSKTFYYDLTYNGEKIETKLKYGISNSRNLNIQSSRFNTFKKYQSKIDYLIISDYWTHDNDYFIFQPCMLINPKTFMIYSTTGIYQNEMAGLSNYINLRELK